MLKEIPSPLADNCFNSMLPDLKTANAYSNAASPTSSPLSRVFLARECYNARFQRPLRLGSAFGLSSTRYPSRKGGDTVKESITSTLYLGLDVSARQNVLCALDFSGDKLLTMKDSNDHPGAENIAAQLNSVW